jgi:hypothetical protein
MSIKSRVEQIASENASVVARAVSNKLYQQNLTSSNAHFGEIKKISGNEITITDDNGTERNLTYIGDRIIGKGDSIIIQGDFAR